MANRILIFSLAYYPVEGGAEIAVREIVERIPDIEFDLVTKRFDKSHAAEERVGNVNIFRIDSSKILFPIKAFLFAKNLHRKNSYIATWSIMAAYAGFAALFFKLCFSKAPFILTLQEGDPLEYIKRRTRFVAPIFKMIFTKADKVQAISKYLSRYASEMGHKGRVEVIPNGVDAEAFENNMSSSERSEFRKRLGLKDKDTILITTSRLVKKNAVSDVIEAVRIMPENIKLLILGTGPLEEKLKFEIRNSKLDLRVKMLGHVPYREIPKYLHISDIFIRPSLSEGFGNSFIEAMAAGIPVIATPVGGIPDFLEDGVTGLFVEPENPRLIPFQVNKLMTDRVLRDKITINAKRMVRDRYEWNLVAKDMKEKVFSL